MTTYQQYTFYSNFAYTVFEYLKRKINRYINPILEVDYVDAVGFTFANIRRPNKVFIHIDNIVTECRNGNNTNKVCSMIIIALTHELHHVEQAMSQELYRIDKCYKITAENSVNFESYNFLLANKNEIDSLFGINLDLSYLEGIIFRLEGDWSEFYKCCNTQQMYEYTIMNVIFRRDNRYYEFADKYLYKYDNIIISFNDEDNFLIKSNGEFCDHNLNAFILAADMAAGKYDRYTVNVSNSEEPYRDNEKVLHLTFTMSNRQIVPIMFREE